jgi:hypothetical protein
MALEWVQNMNKNLLQYYNYYNVKTYQFVVGRYSDSLRAGRSGDRIPVGARFSAPVQTGPGAYPASYTWLPGHSRG